MCEMETLSLEKAGASPWSRAVWPRLSSEATRPRVAGDTTLLRGRVRLPRISVGSRGVWRDEACAGAEEASPDRLCTGYCPMDRRRLWPFWGAQILQIVVRLAVRSVTVLGVWLPVTRTQLFLFSERDCTDPCHRLPSGVAGSRLFASEVQILLLPHAPICTVLRVGFVLTSSSSCHQGRWLPLKSHAPFPDPIPGQGDVLLSLVNPGSCDLPHCRA